MTAKASADQDQSMEEILQSIKRIIADEDDMAQAAPGSEVLELTDVVSEAKDEVLTLEEEAPRDAAMMPARPAAPTSTIDALVSDNTASASASALKSLSEKTRPAMSAPPRIESAAFRSGVTVEDLMMEAMRPMLKDWLDANLKQIVEHLVEKEIRRISQ